MLEIRNLHASINGKEILKGINLTINDGEIHAVMGTNGAGKSTLSNVIVGNPAYEVTEGEIIFNGQNILEMSTEERRPLSYPESPYSQKVTAGSPILGGMWNPENGHRGNKQRAGKAQRGNESIQTPHNT